MNRSVRSTRTGVQSVRSARASQKVLHAGGDAIVMHAKNQLAHGVSKEDVVEDLVATQHVSQRQAATIVAIAAPPVGPAVGQGATEHMPNDTRAYVVVAVSPSGKTVTLAALTGEGEIDRSKRQGGLPVIEKVYSDKQLAAELARYEIRAHDVHLTKATQRKDGRYYLAGTKHARVTFGEAVQRTDYRI